MYGTVKRQVLCGNSSIERIAFSSLMYAERVLACSNQDKLILYHHSTAALVNPCWHRRGRARASATTSAAAAAAAAAAALRPPNGLVHLVP